MREGAHLLDFTALARVLHPETDYYRRTVLLLYADDGHVIGTGALVGPDIVLTVGHTLDHTRPIRVIPGSAYDQGPGSWHGSSQPYGHALVTRRQAWWQDSYDVGVAQVNRPLGFLTGWKLFSVATDYSLVHDTYTLSGYPHEEGSPYADNRDMYTTSGRFDRIHAYLPLVECQQLLYKGMSGSSAWRLGTAQEPCVYALYKQTAPGSEYKSQFMRLTHEVCDWITGWIIQWRSASHDLFPLKMRASATQVKVGETIEWSCVIGNRGSTYYSGDLDHEVYVSADETFADWGKFIGGGTISTYLGAWEQTTLRGSAKVLPFRSGRLFIGLRLPRSGAFTRTWDAQEVEVIRADTRFETMDGVAVGRGGETLAIQTVLRRTTDNGRLTHMPGVHVLVGGKEASGSPTSTDASGQVTLQYTIPIGSPMGELPVLALFDGDGQLHNACSTMIGRIRVLGETVTTATDTTATITEGVTLSGSLHRESDGDWLDGRELGFWVEGTAVGTAFTGATGSRGRADLLWIVPEGAAARTIEVAFAGDEYYGPSSDTALLTCQTWTTKMATFDRTARITDRTELKCRLLRSDNTPLYSKTIQFYIDGTKLQTRQTDVQGYARLPYDVPDGPGAMVRTIRSEWVGNGGYAPISKTANLTVLKAIPYIWVLPKTIPHGAIANLYAYFRRLYDYQKQESKNVDFKIDGTVVQTVATGTGDQAGVARYRYRTTEPPGVHKIRCEFYGDAWLDPGYGEANLTIY